MNKLLNNAFFILLISLIAPKLKAQSYAQQDLKYEIKVKLNDVKHTLSAYEKISYKNNSAFTLNELYFHLWPNAYRDLNSALSKQLLEAGETNLYWSKKEDRGYIDSLNFKINGIAVKHQLLKDTADICRINLPKSLLPGETIEIETPFYVKIPSALFSRLGHIDQQYQITQWYPKPAVFDNGKWKYFPYLNQGEFYSEFGIYDVYITLPENYVVGATGDLVDNNDEIKWLNTLADSTAKISSYNSKDMEFPKSSEKLKTLHYHQEKVHDYAWFADKRYHVLKGEVELPQSKRKVTTWTMFTNSSAKAWSKSIAYINDAVYYYSLWNGDYPYNQCTAVDGTISAGGGMEYPNVTVIGSTNDPFSLDVVIAHEVGHNWFYGILGSNERENGWMDEGINSFNEMRYISTKYPNRLLFGKFAESKMGRLLDLNSYKQNAQYYQAYRFSSCLNADQPIQTHSADFSESNYGTIMYMKTAVVFQYLKSYLGDETFDKAMQAYFNEWKFKHPKPEDLRNILEKVSGKNLSWFFEDLIKTTKKLDYKLINAGTNDKGNFVKIKNTGQIESPFLVSGLINGKERASVWYDGFKGEQWFAFPPGNFDTYKIDLPEAMPEINRKNNTIDNNRLFRKTEPIRLQLLGSLDNSSKTQLFYTPVLGWNKNNGFMLGAAVYNHVVPSKKIEWTAMPMYAFGTKTPVGYADLYYVIKPNNNFYNIRIGANVKSYSYFNNNNIGNLSKNYNYRRLNPSIAFNFKSKNFRSTAQNTLNLRGIFISEDYDQLSNELIFPDQNNLISKKWLSNIAEVSFIHINKKAVNPYNFEIKHTQSDRFARSGLTVNYTVSYPNKKDGFKIRAFAGKMWYAQTYSFNYLQPYSQSYGLSMDGNNDFTYDQIMLDRYQLGNISSRQFYLNDGGFKNITNQLYSYNWLTTLNLAAPIPKTILEPYADFGLSSNNSQLIINTGVAIRIAKDICSIYLPLYQNYKLNQLSYTDKIRFTLQLNKLNPLEAVNNLFRFL